MSVPGSGGRLSARRTAAAEALRDHDRFVSAQELHMHMVGQGTRIGLSTVYRALRELEAVGGVDVTQTGAGERLYRWRRDGEHQHYLLCRRCGSSRPVESAVIEDWTARVISDSGFAAVVHTVELTGACRPCQPAAG
ncbi:Fur family transcriptional regulator [Streptomyces ardesiacus]